MASREKDHLTVAIIGAGAVGLYLAWRLSQQGHYVVVYEKRSGIEAKVCSGLVSERIYDFIPGSVDLVENRISGCNIHFPKKTIHLRFQPRFLCFDRYQLNERLFHLAKMPGVSFVWLSSFNRVKDQMNRFDRVIGCDGAYSEVRKTLGLSSPAMKLGLQAFTDEKDYGSYADVWPTKNGFFWRIPRGERVEYGIMDDKETTLANFLEFAEKLKVLYRVGGISSAPIPQGLRIPRNPKITLCGDAAGLTKPWSGGGLLWGFTAADILVKHLPDLESYRKETEQKFKRQIVLGKIAVSLVRVWSKTGLYPRNVEFDNDFMPLT